MAKNWITGQSGNPQGRARRGRSLAGLLAAVGAERVTFEDPAPGDQLTLFDAGAGQPAAVTMTRRERLARVLWTMALDGDLAAARLIAAYTEGLPVQPVAAGGVVEVRFCADDYARARARLMVFRRELDAGHGDDEPQRLTAG